MKQKTILISILILGLASLCLMGCQKEIVDSNKEGNHFSELNISENCESWFDGCNNCIVENL